MKYTRFEDLPVWRAAIEFAVKVFEFTSKPNFNGHYNLKDQLERAAVSISNNIAEGFERGTTNELLHFLYISRGSAGECRSLTHIFERLPAFADLKVDILDLRSRAESISKQLGSWAQSLQNSEIKGQRFLNDNVRKEGQRQANIEKWREELRQAQEVNIAARERREKLENSEDKTD